ncbi:hypothetical protein M0R45_030442 [Rubus argutus]|uniref:Uncharacterized protein n=1 Tax=Rubus argutus TaxID=59490 RepID=A0AAW1WAQ3_RUBAR
MRPPVANDLAKVSGHLKYALDFSLDFSSRPSQKFCHIKRFCGYWICGVQWMQHMQKLPVLCSKCGSGGINLCGSIALFQLRAS